jgi:GH24 family phage-related lysozyme (muramidase)
MPDPELLAQLRARLQGQAPPVTPDATRIREDRGPVTPINPMVTPLRPANIPAPQTAALDAAIAQATEFIARHEGFRGQAYKDYYGKDHPWTVGYGRTGPDVDSLTTMTESQARAWLEARVRLDADRLQAQGAPVNPSLLSFVYNAGHGRLKSSGALQAALANDWDGVAKSLMKVTKGRDRQHNLVELPGLVKRRREEVAMLRDFLQGQSGNDDRATTYQLRGINDNQ